MNWEGIFGVIFYATVIVLLFLFGGPFFRFISIILAVSFLYIWVKNA